MLWNTHLAGALAAGAVCAVLVPSCSAAGVPQVLGTMVLAGIGGLLPDLDHGSSRISRRFRRLGGVIRRFVSHRGALHAPLFWAAMAPLCARLPWGGDWSGPLVLGVWTHLLLDLVTPGGIPLFWPLSSSRIHLLSIRTGSGGERAVRFVLTLLLASCLPVLLGRMAGLVAAA